MGFRFIQRFFGGCQPQPQYFQQQQVYYPQDYNTGFDPNCMPEQEQYYYPQDNQYCDPQQWNQQPQYYNNSPCNSYPSVNNCMPDYNNGFASQPLQPVPDSQFGNNNANNYHINTKNPNIPDGRNANAWYSLYSDAGITGSRRDKFMNEVYLPLQAEQQRSNMSNEDFNVILYAEVERYKNEQQAPLTPVPPEPMPPANTGDNDGFQPIPKKLVIPGPEGEGPLLPTPTPLAPPGFTPGSST